jgi:hypothetical protein
MPATTLLDRPTSEQDQMLATLRRARYGFEAEVGGAICPSTVIVLEEVNTAACPRCA